MCFFEEGTTKPKSVVSKMEQQNRQKKQIESAILFIV